MFQGEENANDANSLFFLNDVFHLDFATTSKIHHKQNLCMLLNTQYWYCQQCFPYVPTLWQSGVSGN